MLILERIQSANRFVVDEKQCLSAEKKSAMNRKFRPIFWNCAAEANFYLLFA
jgi:hypothetical protein